jgi:hypothetical protein
LDFQSLFAAAAVIVASIRRGRALAGSLAAAAVAVGRDAGDR